MLLDYFFDLFDKMDIIFFGCCVTLVPVWCGATAMPPPLVLARKWPNGTPNTKRSSRHWPAPLTMSWKRTDSGILVKRLDTRRPILPPFSFTAKRMIGLIWSPWETVGYPMTAQHTIQANAVEEDDEIDGRETSDDTQNSPLSISSLPTLYLSLFRSVVPMWSLRDVRPTRSRWWEIAALLFIVHLVENYERNWDSHLNPSAYPILRITEHM